jgi:hypothetical protein
MVFVQRFIIKIIFEIKKYAFDFESQGRVKGNRNRWQAVSRRF